MDHHLFDHLSIGVTDLDRAVGLFDAALSPLGLVRLWRSARAAGYGPPDFRGEAPLALVVPRPGSGAAPSAAFHLALRADSRAAVAAFHAAAVAHGATDDGPPGLREHYGPGYYAAFVLDFDGNRLEAVLHEGGPSSPSDRLVSLARAIGAVDHAALRTLLAPEVRWVQVGRRPVVGIDAVLRVLDRYGPAEALEIGRVVADDRTGVVEGTARIGGKLRSFCHLAELEGGRVRAFTTWLVVTAAADTAG